LPNGPPRAEQRPCHPDAGWRTDQDLTTARVLQPRLQHRLPTYIHLDTGDDSGTRHCQLDNYKSCTAQAKCHRASGSAPFTPAISTFFFLYKCFTSHYTIPHTSFIQPTYTAQLHPLPQQRHVFKTSCLKTSPSCHPTSSTTRGFGQLPKHQSLFHTASPPAGRRPSSSADTFSSLQSSFPPQLVIRFLGSPAQLWALQSIPCTALDALLALPERESLSFHVVVRKILGRDVFLVGFR